MLRTFHGRDFVGVCGRARRNGQTAYDREQY
jgi:hypothetical protein